MHRPTRYDGCKVVRVLVAIDAARNCGLIVNLVERIVIASPRLLGVGVHVACVAQGRELRAADIGERNRHLEPEGRRIAVVNARFLLDTQVTLAPNPGDSPVA